MNSHKARFCSRFARSDETHDRFLHRFECIFFRPSSAVTPTQNWCRNPQICGTVANNGSGEAYTCSCTNSNATDTCCYFHVVLFNTFIAGTRPRKSQRDGREQEEEEEEEEEKTTVSAGHTPTCGRCGQSFLICDNGSARLTGEFIIHGRNRPTRDTGQGGRHFLSHLGESGRNPALWFGTLPAATYTYTYTYRCHTKQDMDLLYVYRLAERNIPAARTLPD